MDLECQSYFYVVPTFKGCLTDFVLCLDSVMENIVQRSGGKLSVSPLLFLDISFIL